MTLQQTARIKAIAGLIDFLDLIEGDPDLEPEEDLGASEDEGAGWSHNRPGIGCPVFDGI